MGDYFVVRTGRRPWLAVAPKGSVVPPFNGVIAWFMVEKGPVWKITGAAVGIASHPMMVAATRRDARRDLGVLAT